MMKDVIEVQPLDGFRLLIRFEDGVAGEIDVQEITGLKGVFSALRDRTAFAAASVHPELGTVVWPNGADLDPDALYARITGRPVPSLAALAESK